MVVTEVFTTWNRLGGVRGGLSFWLEEADELDWGDGDCVRNDGDREPGPPGVGEPPKGDVTNGGRWVCCGVSFTDRVVLGDGGAVCLPLTGVDGSPYGGCAGEVLFEPERPRKVGVSGDLGEGLT